MSRIYRSLDPQKITEVDLRTRQVGPQHNGLPEGGFAGPQSMAQQHEVLTDIERRERESIRLLEQAHREAEAIQADAYRAGFEQGERAGEKLALQKVEPVLQSFRELLNAVVFERQNLILQHEQELIKVAYAIAAQVLHTTLELQPEVLRGVIDAALVKIGPVRPVTLLISPYDCQLIEQQMRRADGDKWPPPNVTLQADDTVGRGGCRILTETGDIDATIDTQLRVLRSTLWNDEL